MIFLNNISLAFADRRIFNNMAFYEAQQGSLNKSLSGKSALTYKITFPYTSNPKSKFLSKKLTAVNMRRRRE